MIGWSNVFAQLPTAGLVAYYPFNENANDESGYGNNGTVYGSTLISDRFGNPNASYFFNGTDNYISVPNSNVLNLTNQFSLCAWVNATSLAQSNYSRDILNKYRESDGSDLFGMRLDEYTPSQLGGYFVNASLQWVRVTDPSTISINQWYFVVCTLDQSLSAYKIYVDGVLKSTTSTTYSCATSTYPLVIGVNSPDAPSGQRFWWGAIDDVRIYNRALNQSEINSLYSECDLSLQVTPSSNSVPKNSNTQFLVSSNDPTATFQWQSNPNNYGWLNVPQNSTYSGTTQNALLINDIQLSNHLQPFRVIASEGTCKDTSNIATLNVIDTCLTIVTVYDTIFNTVTIYDSIAVTDTLIIDVTFTGMNPPNNSNTFKVYPNPTKDKVFINTGNYTLMSDYQIKIINSLGQPVFESFVNQPLFEVNISAFGALGLYYIQLFDGGNQLIDVRKILLE